MPLAMVNPGGVVTVMAVNAGHGLVRRLADMGLYPGVSLRVIQGHPGPLIIQVGASRLALGRGVASKVMVNTV